MYLARMWGCFALCAFFFSNTCLLLKIAILRPFKNILYDFEMAKSARLCIQYLDSGDILGNELSLRQCHVLHLPSLHKTAPSDLASLDDRTSQIAKQTSMSCTAETGEGNANNRMIEFQPGPMG